MEPTTRIDRPFDPFSLDVPAKETVASKAKLVWDTLSKINVNPHVEKKNGFSYLSWAWAWGVLMDNFPNSKFSFDQFGAGGSEVFYYPDGTAEVRCALTVDGVIRVMWLPVMDHRNKPIPSPDARAVNDAKMRCLVKAMSLFGLGHYIYAGEDLPDAESSVRLHTKASEIPSTANKPAESAIARQRTKSESILAAGMNVTKESNSAADLVEELRSSMLASKGLAELKSSFTKASKYANNRNDKEMLQAFTLLKDDLKAKLS